MLLGEQLNYIKENKEYDIGREITLNEFGIEIIRFTNEQVINETDRVIKVIADKITELKKNKSPSEDLGSK